MRFERLHPNPGEVEVAELTASLDLPSRAPVGRPYVVVNMVATIDGKATIAGNTRGLGGDADRTLFHALRGAADAVLVGAGTVREERYGRIIKDLSKPTKPAVVVSGRLDLPSDLPLLQAPDQEVIVATGADHELEGTRAPVSYWRIGDDLPVLLARLRAERQIRALLCEGGPTLNAYMLAAGLVDELFVSVAPSVVAGTDAPTIVGGRPLLEPLRAELTWLLKCGEDLFLRWRFPGPG